MSDSKSAVVSLRLPRASEVRLRAVARRHGWTASEAGARLVEEGLCRQEFAFLDFHDSPVGRQACIQGSTLAVWEVKLLLDDYDQSAAAVAKHLQWPLEKVLAAAAYAAAFPEDIAAAIADNQTSPRALAGLVPQLQQVRVPAPTVRRRGRRG
jgi:hypothetical protein